MKNVGLHEEGDYILEDGKEIIVRKEAVIDEAQEETTLDEKRKNEKSVKNPKAKESRNRIIQRKALRHWFKRKGAKGSKGGWVDCNAPDGKGGYKSCGRGSGEKRKRYPACRPTPSACKERGRGNHGERKDLSEESQEEMKTFSERWLEKKHKRQSSVRQSQKDLRFTLIMTCLLGIMFIATVLADIFLS